MVRICVSLSMINLKTRIFGNCHDGGEIRELFFSEYSRDTLPPPNHVRLWTKEQRPDCIEILHCSFTSISSAEVISCSLQSIQFIIIRLSMAIFSGTGDQIFTEVEFKYARVIRVDK